MRFAFLMFCLPHVYSQSPLPLSLSRNIDSEKWASLISSRKFWNTTIKPYTNIKIQTRQSHTRLLQLLYENLFFKRLVHCPILFTLLYNLKLLAFIIYLQGQTNTIQNYYITAFHPITNQFCNMKNCKVHYRSD